MSEEQNTTENEEQLKIGQEFAVTITFKAVSREKDGSLIAIAEQLSSLQEDDLAMSRLAMQLGPRGEKLILQQAKQFAEAEAEAAKQTDG